MQIFYHYFYLVERLLLTWLYFYITRKVLLSRFVVRKQSVPLWTRALLFLPFATSTRNDPVILQGTTCYPLVLCTSVFITSLGLVDCSYYAKSTYQMLVIVVFCNINEKKNYCVLCLIPCLVPRHLLRRIGCVCWFVCELSEFLRSSQSFS